MFYSVRAGSARRETPGPPRRARLRSNCLKVKMFDVGAGEAILVTAPTGESVLVDGGSTRRPASLANAIAAQIDRGSLKAFIATHPHKDHLSGIENLVGHHSGSAGDDGRAVLARRPRFYESGEAALARNGRLSQWWRDLGSALRTAGVQRKVVTRLTHPRLLGRQVQLSLYLYSGHYTPRDYRSVFMHLVFGQAQFLFTGDSNCDYENLLFGKYAARGLLSAHVLKVTHHGSQNGTSTRFAAAVSPGIAFASTRNDSGHQWKAVARNRLAARCKKFETWTHGDITIRTDGGGYRGGVLFEVSTRRPGRFAGELNLPRRRNPYPANQQTGSSQRPHC